VLLPIKKLHSLKVRKNKIEFMPPKLPKPPHPSKIVVHPLHHARICTGPGKPGKSWNLTRCLTKNGDQLSENLSGETIFLATTLNKVRTKTIEGQYSLVQLEQARLVSNGSLLYGAQRQRTHCYVCYGGNGAYGEIQPRKNQFQNAQVHLKTTLP